MQQLRSYAQVGMHRNVNPLNVLKGEWKKIVNWDLEKKGCFTKRKGYTPVLDVPDASEILSLIPFEMGATRKLIMINGTGNLYVADPVVDSSWGTAILTGLDTTARWTSTVLHDSSGNGVMILGNGVQVYATEDAVTFTDATTNGAPVAKYWATFQERVYGAGVTASKDVLFWSSIGDINNWSSVSPSDSSSLNIDRFSKGTIKNIKQINDRIVIWKNNEMKRWDEEYLRTVRTSHGVIAPYSIDEIDGIAFSLDRDAIRMYDGNSPMEISEKIKDLIYGIDFSDSEKICAKVFKDKYFLSVGDITDEDGEIIENGWIVYDYNKNAFWLYSLQSRAVSMARLVCSDGVERLFWGNEAGNVYKMFDGDTDSGTNIEAKLEGHIFYPAGPETLIRPKEFSIASKFGDEMSIVIDDDNSNNVTNIGECTKPISSNFTNNLGDINGLNIRIYHTSKGTPIFYGFTVGFDVIGSNNSIT